MKNIVAFLTFFAAISFTIGAQKLQIGIKKRVENCEIKAQKGDLVHIHYTVSCQSIPVNLDSHLCIANIIVPLFNLKGYSRGWKSF